MKGMIAEDIAAKSKAIQQARDKNDAKLNELSRQLTDAKAEYN